VWRTYTVPAAGEPAAETWMDDSWKNGGGAAWLVGSYDPQLNLIYFGASFSGRPSLTGHCGHGWTSSLAIAESARGISPRAAHRSGLELSILPANPGL
jgi:hypothetical protein